MNSAQSAQPVVSIRDLCKTFELHHQGGARLPVLREVNFDVHAGECVALDGPSGLGKSTLLKCLFGNYLASSGSIVYHAAHAKVDIVQATPREVLALRRHEIGYVSQFLRAIPRVPSIDIVAEPLLENSDHGPDAIASARRQAEALLLRLRIPVRLWGVAPATFSGGEQQRINIARGLICPRRLLLLDEPTASLDADNRTTVVSLINEARAAGAAIVGIFHDQRVRESVATRVINMKEFV